ncbi:hypothetical protein GTH32_02950 [Alteromonas sp. 345S023]|uniref:Uncharacterized protein n=1 Tax=Alteromonas profundi TaxID=2696062 RepID=A0A7X5RK98_9ALTE|nr:hypothetical protein [Alteromonas profundi]NDV90150.1 hypothetical protein [Alteromonas profundi]
MDLLSLAVVNFLSTLSWQQSQGQTVFTNTWSPFSLGTLPPHLCDEAFASALLPATAPLYIISNVGYPIESKVEARLKRRDYTRLAPALIILKAI